MSMNNIYSPENIARSRGRAAAIREMAEAGKLGADAREWLAAAEAIELDAHYRETDPDGHLAGRYDADATDNG